MMDKSELVEKYKKPCVPGHYKGGNLREAWETPVSVALVAPLESTSAFGQAPGVRLPLGGRDR